MKFVFGVKALDNIYIQIMYKLQVDLQIMYMHTTILFKFHI